MAQVKSYYDKVYKWVPLTWSICDQNLLCIKKYVNNAEIEVEVLQVRLDRRLDISPAVLLYPKEGATP